MAISVHGLSYCPTPERAHLITSLKVLFPNMSLTMALKLRASEFERGVHFSPQQPLGDPGSHQWAVSPHRDPSSGSLVFCGLCLPGRSSRRARVRSSPLGVPCLATEFWGQCGHL